MHNLISHSLHTHLSERHQCCWLRCLGSFINHHHVELPASTSASKMQGNTSKNLNRTWARIITTPQPSDGCHTAILACPGSVSNQSSSSHRQHGVDCVQAGPPLTQSMQDPSPAPTVKDANLQTKLTVGSGVGLQHQSTSRTPPAPPSKPAEQLPLRASQPEPSAVLLFSQVPLTRPLLLLLKTHAVPFQHPCQWPCCCGSGLGWCGTCCKCDSTHVTV